MLTVNDVDSVKQKQDGVKKYVKHIMQDKNKQPYNENGIAHGYWEIYDIDGTLWSKRNYINGVLFGYYEFFYGDSIIPNKIYHAR
jgi:antitoxin component YwqK of YwqJK toxin-antitoxin module